MADKGIKEYGGTPGPTKGVQEYGGTPDFKTKGVQEYGGTPGPTKPKALDDPEGFIMDYPPYGSRQRPNRYNQGGKVAYSKGCKQLSCKDY